MPNDPRKLLAIQQRALVDALAGKDVAHDFDARQIATADRSLLTKRMRTVQKAWPALAEAVTDTNGALFRDYAARYPIPCTGALDDARGFLRFVHERADDELKLTLCSLRATCGWPIRFVWSRAGVAIAVRLWRLGVRTSIWRRRASERV